MLRRALRQRDENETASGELNIVPFLDIVTNLMLFLMATTAAITATSEVRADLPGYGPHRGVVGLSVTLTERGAVMATSEGRLGPLCSPSTDGAPTATRTIDGFDFAALTRCAAYVHRRHPDDPTVTVSADPGIGYGDVIRAMDAMRSDGDQAMFPDVRISAGVR